MDRFPLTPLRRAVLAAVCLAWLGAPTSAQTLLDSIPTYELPLLPAELRRALAERWQGGQHPALIQNALGGTCVLDSLSATYMRLYPTQANKVEVRTLADGRHLLVHTVTQPALDSRLTTYDAQWRPTATRIAEPRVEDFYTPCDTVPLEVFRAYAMPFVVAYRIEGDSLVATYSPRPYLPDEDYQRIAPALRTAPIVLPLSE